MHRRRSGQDGYTLIELAIVLALMGAVLMLAVPRMEPARDLATAGRSLIRLIHAAASAASSTRTSYRLSIDFAERTYRVMKPTPDGERPPADPTLAREAVLPAGIRFLDLTVGSGERIVSGRTAIAFHPTGRTEQAVLHLTDGAGEVMTIVIPPMTAFIQVREGYVERVTSPPISEPLRSALLFVPPPPPAPPSPSGSDGAPPPAGQSSPSTSPPAALTNALSGATGGAPAAAPQPPSAPAASVFSPTKNPNVNIPWVR